MKLGKESNIKIKVDINAQMNMTTNDTNTIKIEINST